MLDENAHDVVDQHLNVPFRRHTIRILLADDHVVLRQGTAELLRRESDLMVIGEASDGQRAIELAEALKPDLVVMDVRMPGMSGIEATRRIRQTLNEVRVLVLTAHDDLQYVFSLLQAGASGYLLKTAPIANLIEAIRRIHAGEMALAPEIAQKLALYKSVGGEHQPGLNPETAILEELTARELTVLQFLARGLSNQAIAETLSISDRTVQAHLTRLFSKMNVTSRLEAVLMAIRLGWLTLNP
jgi:DNA-binding NarL/FixJ family response regulator